MSASAIPARAASSSSSAYYQDASWEQVVKAKKAQLATAIPAEWRLEKQRVAELTRTGDLMSSQAALRSGVLSVDELDLTEKHTARQLVEMMARRQVTSEQVVTAFCKRAAVAQQLTSCLTEMFFDEAIARAKVLDQTLRETGKPVGPLHGLPVSLKDTYKVLGYDASAGFVNGLREGPAKSNSHLVTLLLEAGAVPYVKSNVPQTLMTADSENNIYGRALNPRNLKLNAGGSSGGEGAIVGFRGSPLGVGTDVAGSIRIPSGCCGTYGFKPSNHRVPYGNQSEGNPPVLPGPWPSAGPLANSLDDLELFMSTVIGLRPARLDSTALDMPWIPKTIAPGARLRIGLVEEDPSWPLSPPMRRALHEAQKAVAAAGHTVVRLPRDPARSVELGLHLATQFFELASVENPDQDLAALIGEPLIASVANRTSPFSAEKPPPVKFEGSTIEYIDRLENARLSYVGAWHAAFNDHRLDALLGPGAHSTAVAHDTYGSMPYTVLFNILDYPSCLIPYSKASKVLDPEPWISDVPGLPDYVPEDVDGMPCSVQVAATKLREEHCLAVAREVDAILHPRRKL